MKQKDHEWEHPGLQSDFEGSLATDQDPVSKKKDLFHNRN